MLASSALTDTKTTRPEKLALSWLDLILAGLLIVSGAGAWGAADSVVASLMDEPDLQEFLAGREVRTVELQLKTAQSELDATRNKWIEHRLAGTPNQLEPTLPALEAKQLALEKALADVRRQVTRDFERQARWFRLKKRVFTLALGVVAAAIALLAVRIAGSFAATRLNVQPNWGAALPLAESVLALLFGYETGGIPGAGLAVFAVIVLVLRR